jgi:hypothetical protein
MERGHHQVLIGSTEIKIAVSYRKNNPEQCPGRAGWQSPPISVTERTRCAGGSL